MHLMRHWRIAGLVGRSLWQLCGLSDGGWNRFVECFNSINRFDFGIPGFEVTLDWVDNWCRKGNSVFSPVDKEVWLDAFFAYHVWHRGERVLTIGFNFAADSVVVQQVQSAKKRGNRWLYKLPTHFFDYALQRMAACFGSVVLVGAKECVHQIRLSYGRHAEKFEQSMEDRVVALYSRRLESFTRVHAPRIRGGRYYRLVPRVFMEKAVRKSPDPCLV